MLKISIGQNSSLPEQLPPFDPSKLFLELDVPHSSLSPDTFLSLADPANGSFHPAHSTHLELVTDPTQALLHLHLSSRQAVAFFAGKNKESVVGHKAQSGAGDSAGRRG